MKAVRVHEFGPPEVLSYDEIALTIARAAGRDRPLVHVPLGLVHLSLVLLRRVFGDEAFATWEEAELMEVPMTTERGPEDAKRLGVEPRPMADVLGFMNTTGTSGVGLFDSWEWAW